MNNIILTLCSVFTVELVLRINLISKLTILNNFFKEIKKILFSKKFSDKKKENLLKKYSVKLFKKIITMFFLTLISFSSFCLFIILDYYFQFGFLQLLMSVKGIITSIIIALVYGKLRSYVFK